MEDTVVKTMWSVAQQYSEWPALISKTGNGEWTTLRYKEFASQFECFGAGLLDFGVKRGDHVGVIADNRKEWIIANLGIQGIGAADVPRGSDTMADEARYILQHADCTVTLVENAEQLKKVLSRKHELPRLTSLIVMDNDVQLDAVADSNGGVGVVAFRDIMARGSRLLASDPQAFRKEMAKGASADLATIIYTSGTTGEPKGVMLTHANFLHQIRTPVPKAIEIGPGDVFLAVLPVWHSFERVVNIIVLTHGAALAYSKPVGKIMLADMAVVQPTVMASVPRIWEGVRSAVYRNINEEGGLKKPLFHFFVAVGAAHATASALVSGRYPQFSRRFFITDFLLGILPFILLMPFNALGELLVFKRIKQRLGGRFRFTVSGGGALPSQVDKFFQAVGVLLLEGYGLTETSPVISVRLQNKPVPGTIGPLLDEQEIRLLDPETGVAVGPGRKGIIHVRGPNVMKGYYKRPDKTAEVLSPDGWLNTGDLGIMTYRGELKIIGRTKETIVLLGGENVEPVPIEDTILESEYIDQAMVVGQDQKFLAALVVPNDEAVEKYAAEKKIGWLEKNDLLDNSQIQGLIYDEINSRVCAKRGFREFERIFRFKLLPKHFEAGVELSAKASVKRHVVSEIYRREIASLFQR
jgi:long-chain acyl-CoA synthetase